MIDLLILAIVVIQVHHWAQIGLIRGGFSLGGFTIGLVGGVLLAPLTARLVDTPLAKFTTVMIVILLLAGLLGSLGRLAGEHLSGLSKRLKLGRLDSVLGAGLGAILTLFFIWIFAAILSGTQFPELNRGLRSSAILRAMDRRLPPPPSVVSKITTFINTHGFPQVFVGLEPRPVAPVGIPSSQEVASALAAAGTSTVRIEGLGCGGVVNGSGFIAAPDLVVTNAHVVAGIRRPTVVDIKGRHTASTVYFNKDLDLAVLKTSGLAGKPLKIAEDTLPRGTAAAVLGYPGGGRLSAVPAGILRQMLARGRDIYGGSITIRSIYELQTEIESGNSGGPVVLPDGTVIGIVFAKSQSEASVGYSLVSSAITQHIKQAQKQTQPVSTAACVAG